MKKDCLPLKNLTRVSFAAACSGALAGLFNGLFGGGGGMVVVPALRTLSGFKQKEAHATAILIILPLSITSGMAYLTFTRSVVSVALPVIAGAAIGGAAGAFFLKKLSSPIVGVIFALLMAAAGIKMLVF